MMKTKDDHRDSLLVNAGGGAAALLALLAHAWFGLGWVIVLVCSTWAAWHYYMAKEE